jgi:hypothetical protein
MATGTEGREAEHAKARRRAPSDRGLAGRTAGIRPWAEPGVRGRSKKSDSQRAITPAARPLDGLAAGR